MSLDQSDLNPPSFVQKHLPPMAFLPESQTRLIDDVLGLDKANQLVHVELGDLFAAIFKNKTTSTVLDHELGRLNPNDSGLSLINLRENEEYLHWCEG